MQTAIQLIIYNLTAARGTRTIFRSLNLSARSGQAIVISGPNGAGKTTLLRCVAGFLAPESGSVTVKSGAGEAVPSEQCHYIGHLNGIKSALTVAENLAFFADFLGGSRVEAARAAGHMALGGLEDIPAAYLSAGQKRRLGLARLICARRPVWLLDEPAVSLDTASQGLLANAVASHLDGGGIVLAVTHAPLGWSKAETAEFASLCGRSGEAVA